MEIGDRTRMVPGVMRSAWDVPMSAPLPCRVVSINRSHRHFTVEFKFPGGSYRETYKEDCYGDS